MAEPTLSLEELRYPIGHFKAPASFNEEDIPTWLSAIEALPLWLDVIIENLDEYQLNTPYRPEGWTMVQTIHHLADSHMHSYIRTKFALTGNEPTIMAYDENLWAGLIDAKSGPLESSLVLLDGLHAR